MYKDRHVVQRRRNRHRTLPSSKHCRDHPVQSLYQGPHMQKNVYFNLKSKHHKIITFFGSISLHHLGDILSSDEAGRPPRALSREAPKRHESVRKTRPLFTSYTIFSIHKKKLFITHGAKQRRLHMTSFHINISFAQSK
jgi:hypothetical protein